MRSTGTHMRSLFFIMIFTFALSQQPADLLPSTQQPQMPPDPKLEKALLEYEQLLKEHPDKKELNYNMGNIKYLMGDLESAVSEYQKAEGVPDNISRSHAYYNAGNAMVQQENLQEAISLYKNAMLLNPEAQICEMNCVN